MKASCFAVCAGALLLVSGCAKPVKKVLLIGIDGVRSDVLAEVPTPNIDSLAAAGMFVDSIPTKAQTISGPAWSSILTGVWPDKHLVVSNDLSTNNFAHYPDFLTRLELVNAAFATFAVLDWPPLGTKAAGGPLISEAIDTKINIDGDELGYRPADSLSVAAAVKHLADRDPDAVFVYLGYPDVAAHESGGLSPEYMASIAVADAQVGELTAALRRRSTYGNEDWLILICTDHGHLAEGGHGGDSPEETMIFYLASGPSVKRGPPDVEPNLVDVAVTAMAHLGVPAEPSWSLDGKVVGLAHVY
jgi:predicted AlkP superfamily pyrophosphatase or phosphodiesterase